MARDPVVRALLDLATRRASAADARRQRSAEPLRALAEHVRTQPDDDPRIAALAHVASDRDTLEGEGVAAVIARFGLRGRATGADLDRFLDDLVEAAVTHGFGMVAD